MGALEFHPLEDEERSLGEAAGRTTTKAKERDTPKATAPAAAKRQALRTSNPAMLRLVGQYGLKGSIMFDQKK